MNSEDYAKTLAEQMARTYDHAFLDALNGYGPAQTARVEPKLCRQVVGDEDPEHKGLIRYTLGGVDYTKEIAPPKPPTLRCDSKTASVVRMQREVAAWKELWAAFPPRSQASARPKADPAPLTFTALQETVLPDLYGKKQHAQLLAAAKQREKDAAARLREETNNKIGGLLRGFLGARREEEL